MNRDDDLIGQLEDYLADVGGVSSLPDRVRDAIRAELPRTRQVRRVSGSGRMFDMVSRASTRARWGLAAAAVVAAVFLGAAVLNNGGTGPGVGSAPATASPSPSPSPSPSLSPTPAPPTTLSRAPQEACDSGGGTCIVAGTYSLTSPDWPGRVTVDVPAGWFQYGPAMDYEGVLVDGGPDALDGSGWGVMFIQVGPVSIDPCDRARGTLDPARTSTVDGLVTAISSWPGFQATAPTPIEVDGFGGQLVELTSTRTSTDCPTPVLWITPRSWYLDAYPIVNATATPHTSQLWIVDVDGTLLVIRTTDFPETSPFEVEQGVAPDPTRHAADQVELHQILDSIRITVAP